MNQNELKNDAIKNYNFLQGMYGDSYFPTFLVDKVKLVLLELCKKIETTAPQNLEALYTLSHASTEAINDLQEEFYEHDSEIETAARDTIAVDVEFIATSYGFEADIEELVAPRDW